MSAHPEIEKFYMMGCSDCNSKVAVPTKDAAVAAAEAHEQLEPEHQAFTGEGYERGEA